MVSKKHETSRQQSLNSFVLMRGTPGLNFVVPWRLAKLMAEAYFRFIANLQTKTEIS